jgi:hypothetical protein
MPPVYYHETIVPSSVREKEVEYLETMGDIVTNRVNQSGSAMRSVANWVTIWATGRWPEIIGLWEMADWSWFVEHFSDFDLLVDHPAGFEQYRSGGFDRLLVPFDGTPTLDEISSERIRAPFILQETVQLAPGQATEYLEKLFNACAELRDRDSSIRLHGAYTVLLRDRSEVLVQWALKDLEAFVSVEARNAEEYPALARWRIEARQLERSHVGVLLKPTGWSSLS